MNQLTNLHPKRIFLIGFMGTGKSTIGRLLAGLLGCKFIDLDTLVEQIAGLSISQIFEQKGEPWFRNTEAECLRQTIQYAEVIVATGGGTPCHNENMRWMNEHGITIFLQTSPRVLAKRLRKAMLHRPLIAGFENKQKLLTYVENKLVERHYYYDQCQITVYCNKREVFSVANELKQLLEKW
ncbi:shikimate kinase [Sphingobacteriales bacterium UPWRP_1]|nr:hypothetical protein BVG80_18415 [Sphingobacteriales bacterium TSM_CSM]PSJ73406.1 shikimate kinase [Sphingobacteriales bacterium UPWRP_1]